MIRTVKEVKTALELYSDKELKGELERRRKKHKGRVLGYYAVLFGDEYDYGFVNEFRIGSQYRFGPAARPHTKQTTKQAAEEAVARHSKGGWIQPFYKDSVKPKSV